MDINLRSLLVGGAVASALFLGIAFRPAPQAPAFTYRQFSTIESVVPGGLGRSRMIISGTDDQTIEKDLLNFYSMTGINFKNVANNDRIIVDNINQYTAEGWELYTVTTGVQSPAEGGGNGIFITRYLFRRAV
jgi:hypothetical protein